MGENEITLETFGREIAKRKRRTINPDIKEILDLWNACNMPISKAPFYVVHKKIKDFLQEGSCTIEQVKKAITNYSQSKWHRDNGYLRSIITFLNKDFIMKWQEPRREYIYQKRYTPSTSNELDYIINHMIPEERMPD